MNNLIYLMNLFLLFLLFFFIIYMFITNNKMNTYSLFFNKLLMMISSYFNIISMKLLLFILGYMISLTMLFSSVPFFKIPVMFYSFTFLLSMVYFLSIVIFVLNFNYKNFISHFLPLGSPQFLMMFLPLIELFSFSIRPFTLMIRFSTNISAGHIMMCMFSFFMMTGFLMSKIILIFIFLLMMLEIFLALLQGYIFNTLLTLYLEETI